MKYLVLAILSITVLSGSFAALAALTDMNVAPMNDNALASKNAYVDAVVLTAGEPRVYNVPSYVEAGVTKYARYVVFSSEGSFYARLSGPAVLPSADVLDGSAPELNPDVRWLNGNVQTIGLVSDSDATVTMTFFK